MINIKDIVDGSSEESHKSHKYTHVIGYKAKLGGFVMGWIWQKSQKFKLFYVKIKMPHNLGVKNEPNNEEARTIIKNNMHIKIERVKFFPC